MSAKNCPQCGSEIGPAFKACPVCRWLVHGEQLKVLATAARQASADGNLLDALTSWREALDLLPPESQQYEIVQKEASELSLKLASTPTAQLKPSQKKNKPANIPGALGALGAAVVILLKFKSLFAVIIAESKLVFMGLGKGATAGSMAVSLGLYSTLWSWKFALAVILGIYVHEIGHVWMMKRFGMKMGAPLFIPGIGAFVQMKQRPLNRVEDARIGIAGPIWGMIFVLGAYLGFRLSDLEWLGKLVHLLAWITIFNLIPVWQLDGARAFQAFSPTARMLVLAVAGIAWVGTQEGLLALLGLMTLMAVNTGDSAQKTDRPTWLFYMAILIAAIFLTHFTPGLHAKS